MRLSSTGKRNRRTKQRRIGNSRNDLVEGEVGSLELLRSLGRGRTSTVTRKDMKNWSLCAATTKGGRGRREECKEEFREQECRP